MALVPGTIVFQQPQSNVWIPLISPVLSVLAAFGVLALGKRIEHKKDAEEKSRKIKYLVIQLIIILENYALQCAGYIEKHSEQYEMGFLDIDYHYLKESLEQIPILINTSDYMLLHTEHMVAVLQFPHQIKILQKNIYNSLEHTHADEIIDKFEDAVHLTARNALLLAQKLRDTYSLPIEAMQEETQTLLVILEKKVAKAEHLKKKREQALKNDEES